MADYYMDPAGNDGAAGGLATPWKTFEHSLGELTAGDTLMVNAGTYPVGNEGGSAVSEASGTGSSRITVTSHNGQVEFDGGAYSNLGFQINHDFWTIRGIERFDFEGGINIYGEYCIVEDCVLYNLFDDVAEPAEDSTTGIFLSGSGAGARRGNIIRRNVLHNIPAGEGWEPKGEAIYSGNSNSSYQEDLEIYDNEIYDCAQAVDLKNGTSTYTIHHNTFHDMKSTPLHRAVIISEPLRAGSRGRIEQNLFYAHQGAVRVFSNVDVWNNVLRDALSATSTIYTGIVIWGSGADGGDDNTIYNNTVVRCWRGMHFQSTRENCDRNSIKNNIFAENDDYQIEPKTLAPLGDDNVFDHNSLSGAKDHEALEVAGPNGFYGVDGENTGPNPKFIDSAGGNFHLADSSPCRKAGVGLSEISVDYDGKKRYGAQIDMGAFQSSLATPHAFRSVMGRGSVGGRGIVR